jgi:hypothetical protein
MIKKKEKIETKVKYKKYNKNIGKKPTAHKHGPCP